MYVRWRDVIVDWWICGKKNWMCKGNEWMLSSKDKIDKKKKFLNLHGGILRSSFVHSWCVGEWASNVQSLRSWKLVCGYGGGDVWWRRKLDVESERFKEGNKYSRLVCCLFNWCLESDRYDYNCWLALVLGCCLVLVLVLVMVVVRDDVDQHLTRLEGWKWRETRRTWRWQMSKFDEESMKFRILVEGTSRSFLD